MHSASQKENFFFFFFLFFFFPSSALPPSLRPALHAPRSQKIFYFLMLQEKETLGCKCQCEGYTLEDS